MKIQSKLEDVITMTLTESEFNFLRSVITGYQINTPKQAWSTYSGYNEDEMNEFVDNMFSEAEKFEIEL
jgi:hypothetical protein